MEVPAAVSGTAQAHHGSRGRARVLAPAQISSRGVDVGDTADRGAKAAPFRPPLGTGRAPGKAPPSAENAFPIDCRSELGESSSCHDTSFPCSPGLRGPPLVGFVVSGLIQLPEVDDSRSACRHWRRRPARLPECGGNPGFWRRQNGVRHDLDGESAPGGRALFQGEAGTLSDSQHRRLAQDRPSLTRLGAALVSSLKNSTFYGRPPSRGPSTCGSRFSSR